MERQAGRRLMLFTPVVEQRNIILNADGSTIPTPRPLFENPEVVVVTPSPRPPVVVPRHVGVTPRCLFGTPVVKRRNNHGVTTTPRPPADQQDPQSFVDDFGNNQGEEEAEILKPQALLKSIDIVHKLYMQKLARLKRTPAAKKAERESRVRTLMSMR